MVILKDFGPLNQSITTAKQVNESQLRWDLTHSDWHDQHSDFDSWRNSSYLSLAEHFELQPPTISASQDGCKNTGIIYICNIQGGSKSLSM